MVFIARQEHFTCGHCGKDVSPLPQGSYRNHCPHCLWSKHVDADGPGDRASVCQGLMEPIELDQRGNKGWLIVHICVQCRKRIPNKAAPDDDLAGFSPHNAGW